MENIVVDMYDKFHNDRLRNDKALVLWKSDKNKNPKNNVGSTLHLFPALNLTLYCTMI